MANVNTPAEIQAIKEDAAKKATEASTNDALANAEQAVKDAEKEAKKNPTLTSLVTAANKLTGEFFEKEKLQIRQLLDTAEVLGKKRGEIYLQVYNAIPEAIRESNFQGFLMTLYPELPSEVEGKKTSWADLQKLRKEAKLDNKQEEAYRTINNFKSWASTYKLTLKKQQLAQTEEEKRKEAEAKGETYEPTPKTTKAPRLFKEDMKDGKVVQVVNPKIDKDTLIKALEMKGVKMIPAASLEKTACENPSLLFDALIKEANSHVKNPTKAIAALEAAKRMFLVGIVHEGPDAGEQKAS